MRFSLRELLVDFTSFCQIRFRLLLSDEILSEVYSGCQLRRQRQRHVLHHNRFEHLLVTVPEADSIGPYAHCNL